MGQTQSLSEADWLTVNDIKQFLYCQRIPFYNRVQGLVSKRTFKMEYGNMLQSKLESLESRRKLKKFGLDSGERIFNLRLASETLKISGMLDCLIKANGSFYPLDYKATGSGLAYNHRIQLCAYSMLVEERFRCSVSKAFVVTVTDYAKIGSRAAGQTSGSYRIHEVAIDETLRDKTNDAIGQIRANSRMQKFPPPAKERAKCTFCEFRNFCGDVF